VLTCEVVWVSYAFTLYVLDEFDLRKGKGTVKHLDKMRDMELLTIMSCARSLSEVKNHVKLLPKIMTETRPNKKIFPCLLNNRRIY